MTRVINGDSRHDSKYHLQAEGGEGEEMRVVVVFHRCIVFLRSTVHEFSWIYHWANRFYEWRPTYTHVYPRMIPGGCISSTIPSWSRDWSKKSTRGLRAWKTKGEYGWWEREPTDFELSCFFRIRRRFFFLPFLFLFLLFSFFFFEPLTESELAIISGI